MALMQAGVAAGPVQDMAQAFRHAQTQASGMWPPLGGHHVIASPMKLNRTPPEALIPPGPFGRDADAVLRDAGYDARDISHLEAQGGAGAAAHLRMGRRRGGVPVRMWREARPDTPTVRTELVEVRCAMHQGPPFDKLRAIGNTSSGPNGPRVERCSRPPAPALRLILEEQLPVWRVLGIQGHHRAPQGHGIGPPPCRSSTGAATRRSSPARQRPAARARPVAPAGRGPWHRPGWRPRCPAGKRPCAGPARWPRPPPPTKLACVPPTAPAARGSSCAAVPSSPAAWKRCSSRTSEARLSSCGGGPAGVARPSGKEPNAPGVAMQAQPQVAVQHQAAACEGIDEDVEEVAHAAPAAQHQLGHAGGSGVLDGGTPATRCCAPTASARSKPSHLRASSGDAPSSDCQWCMPAGRPRRCPPAARGAPGPACDGSRAAAAQSPAPRCRGPRPRSPGSSAGAAGR